MMHEVTITPADIRQAWDSIQRGVSPLSDRQAGSGVQHRITAGDYRGTTVNRWIGASGAEIQDRLQNGYYVEGEDLNIGSGQAVIAPPMVDLVEEDGDLILSQVLGGEDLMYAQWEPSDAPRGLTIRACIGMHAGTDAKVIGDYFAWILKVIDAAERRGVAPDVELWIGSKGGFQRRPREQMIVRIPLVKAGEIIDAVAWRAFLTPGAFRSLGFVALGLAADRINRRLTLGLGAPTNKQWAVTLTDDVLEIECPGGDQRFPEQDMNRLLEAAYAGA